MQISEEMKNKIIELYCNTNKIIRTIYQEVAPNGEITFEELNSIINEYNEKNIDKLKKTKKECSAGEILELLEKGLSQKEVGEQLGVSPDAISKRIKKMRERGVDIPERKNEKDEKILELLEKGLNQTEVGKQLGVSKAAISLRIKNIKKRGVDIPERKNENDEKILELLEKGLSQKEVGEQLGVSPDAISKRIKKMRERGVDIPERKNKKDEKILELLEKGLNQNKIAKQLGVSAKIVSIRIKKMRERGVEIPERKKENDERDNKILELLEKGFSQKEVGEQLGVSPEAISYRIKRMRERGVEVPKNKRTARKTENDEKDNEILEMLENGLSQIEIRKQLGESAYVISKRIKKMRERGVDIPERKNKNDEKILELLEKGLSQIEIRKQLGESAYVISKRIKKMRERGVNIPERKRAPRKICDDEKDNKILELLEKGLNQTEVGKQLGVSKAAISLRIKNIKKRGVDIPERKNENDEKILELLEKGLSQKEVGEQLGVSKTTISKRIRMMRELGVEIPKNKRNPRKTENDERDNKILEMLEKGLNQAEVGKQLGVSCDAISKRVKKMRERGVEIPKRKNESDEKILELLEKGLNQNKIAKQLGVSAEVVSIRIKKMRERGVEIPKRKKENDERDNKILELLEKGLTLNKIAIQLGVSDNAISKRIKKMKERGVEIPKRIKKRNNKDAKFKEKKIEDGIAKEIVNLINTKNASIEQVRSMAKLYGVDKKVEELLKSLDEQER